MVRQSLHIPLDVPRASRRTYLDNIERMTFGSGRLMLMAGDQKVEHLNDDFTGPGISEEDAHPEHLFRIASRARIGAFATQLGLISRFGDDHRSIPYVVKMNSKTHLVPTEQRDPLSRQWVTLEQVARFRAESGLRIVGVGYTIYPGSENESQMLTEASRLVVDAHRLGLVAIIWAYPRGRAVTSERDPHLLAGVAGLVACLGADFVKLNHPLVDGAEAAPEMLREAVKAAGRTRVICAGGHETQPAEFLTRLYGQIHVGGTAGSATGRNIHQRAQDDAVRFCDAISAVVYDQRTVEQALSEFESSRTGDT